MKLKVATTEEHFNGHSEDKEWLNLSIIHQHLPGPSVKCFAYLNNLTQRLKPPPPFSMYMQFQGAWNMITKAQGWCCVFIKSQHNCLSKNVCLLKLYYWSFSFAESALIKCRTSEQTFTSSNFFSKTSWTSSQKFLEKIWDEWNAAWRDTDCEGAKSLAEAQFPQFLWQGPASKFVY